MLTYPAIDPVAIAIGPLKVHWYGLMYLAGFAAAWGLGRYRAGKPGAIFSAQQVGDIVFWGAVGLVLGARMGYVLFYQFGQFLENPLWLFALWEGGMSFHGGLLGVAVALIFYARSIGSPFFAVVDYMIPMTPIGLACGRIGNFINGELWGRVTDVPWGMVFPGAGTLPRHPSQLYEMALEGVVLFLVLWVYSSKPRPMMAVTGLFLLLYGVFRSFVELFREPDAHLGFIAMDWLTMGQILSLPMILGGAGLMIWSYRFNSVVSGASGKGPVTGAGS